MYKEGPPYHTPGGPKARMKKIAGASVGRIRHPRVHIPMQAPTDTIYGVARQTCHHAAPYPEPGARPRPRGNTS